MPTDTFADPLEEPMPQFDPATLQSQLRVHWGVSGELARLYGERDLNLAVRADDGRRYVLKVHNPAETADVLAMRSGAMAHVRRVDATLPVPELIVTLDGNSFAPLTADDGRRSYAELVSHLDGRHIASSELDTEALSTWAQTAARLGRALRGYFHPAAGAIIQWDVRHTGALRRLFDDLPPETRATVARVVDRFEERVEPNYVRLRAQVVHNDFGPTNVLVDSPDNITGITDFGDVAHTALVGDVAILLSNLLVGRKDWVDAARAALAGYTLVTPLEQAELDLIGDLVCARLAIELTVSAWREKLHEDAPAYFAEAFVLLRDIERFGFDAFGAHLAAAVSPTVTASLTEVPYRLCPTDELLDRRRRVLGSLELSYDVPLHLVRGVGAYVYDREGRRYLDAYNNVQVVGHSHPAVASAIATQARLLAINSRYLHEASVELAESLIAVAPAGVDRVVFVNSGSEAVELAWRIAKHATGRSGAVVSRFAYHGVTEATNDFSPEEWPRGYRPRHVARLLPPGDLPHEGDNETVAETFEAALDILASNGHELAAFIVDPAFTSDGIQKPPPVWFKDVVAATAGAGGLFVADEVQIGYGRTGEDFFGIGALGVGPDLVTIGKPMGNGFPVAAVLGRSGLIDSFIEETGYFSTFGGNTLSCTAALAVMRVIEHDHLVERAAEIGAYLRERLDAALAPFEQQVAVRSWGMLAGIELSAPGAAHPAKSGAELAARVVNEMCERGVLVGRTGIDHNVVKIRPPLAVGRDAVDEIATRCCEVLAEVRSPNAAGAGRRTRRGPRPR
jgi:4-aminobutyrate aminotransferase-like enzyme/Ser/Thr protein kinase RdoA (MazF antagonist)